MRQPYLSRRALMQMSAGALLSAGIWPGALAAEGAVAGDFPFICVNDLHYFDAGCIPFFTRMIKLMKEASPDSSLLLVGGDLVEHGKAEEFDAILKVIKTSGMEMKTVIGNHDWATMTDAKAFNEACPDSLNYTFEHHGWQVVGLDSSQGTSSTSTIKKETFDWMAANLPKIDKKRPMVVMTHFPLGAGVTNRAKNADQFLEPFKEYNVRAIFNGHYHAQTEKTINDYLVTTGRCCSFRASNHDGSKQKGFFSCQAKNGKIERKFVEVPMA
jgi:3',5'-cyclic AMP phosphodiesterase CpdA